MKELKKRTNVVENSVEAYALRACGCGCSCECACGCSSHNPSLSTRNRTGNDIGKQEKNGTSARVR